MLDFTNIYDISYNMKRAAQYLDRQLKGFRPLVSAKPPKGWVRAVREILVVGRCRRGRAVAAAGM